MLEAKDPVIARAVKVLDLLSSDPETVRLYELREKAIWDEVSRINSARADGLAEGLDKGRAEGRIEGQSQIVRAMAAKGFSVEEIANMTNLSADEVERLLRLEQ